MAVLLTTTVNNMRFKKGSKEAKAFMAKLRAAKGKSKKVGANKKLKKLTPKKVGSTLKLTPKETRLGATEKDFKPKSKFYHKDTKSHNVNIRVISGFNELTAKQKTLYNKLYNSYNKSGLYKIVNFEKYVMQNIVIAEAKRKSTIDLYKIYDFVQNDY
jgi:hypothetical protein